MHCADISYWTVASTAMKVIVLGAGVVGLTSAWYLAQAGHQVTVIDRQAQSGEEVVSSKAFTTCYKARYVARVISLDHANAKKLY